MRRNVGVNWPFNSADFPLEDALPKAFNLSVTPFDG